MLSPVERLCTHTRAEDTMVRRIPLCLRSLLAMGGVLVIGSAGRADTATWNGGNGVWSNSGNWTPAVVPDGLNFDVVIDGRKAIASQVTVDVSPTVNSLTLNGDDSVIVPGPQSLFIDGGTSINDGSIQVNSGGLLYLLPGDFTNNGSISATGASSVVVIDLSRPGTFSSPGTVSASAGAMIALSSGTHSSTPFSLNAATLDLESGATLDNTGRTVAPGVGSTVLIQGGSRILGGLVDASPGIVTVVDSGTLEDLSLGGIVTQVQGADTTLRGTITTPAPATIEADTPGGSYTVHLSGNVTLAGTNSLSIADQAVVEGLSGGETLTNGTGHVLRIVGPVETSNLTLLNQGTIQIVPGSTGLVVGGNTAFEDGTLQEVLGGGDALHVQGNLSLGGTDDALALAGGSPGSTYVVADYSGVLTGAFEHVTPGYTVTYDTAARQILATVAVPEPMGAGMLVMALVAFHRPGRRWRYSIRKAGRILGRF